MQAFDIALYALAIITVLLLRAETTTATAPTEAPQPQPEPQPQPAKISDPLPATPAIAATIASPAAVAVVKVAKAKGSTDYSTLKTPQLRQLCGQRGIVWRNALGANKHLSKAAMIAALSA